MILDPVVVDGRYFRDTTGRSLLLRGVNLGGDCKLPYPFGGTNYPTDFSDHRTVTFIGRPFPIDEAHEHLRRLKHWGFNVIRLLTTWEAIEHAGPGLYDEAYLEYFAEICRLAGEYGLYVFVTLHEDAWSRMTGGSGAPGWTFEAAGLDFTRFHAAGLSHVMQLKYDYSRGGRQDAYPQMSWGSNHRLAPGPIMWTLFFTGKIFTPDFMIDGRNIQDYLQSHFIGAMRAIAERVKDLPNVLGFDAMNEPVAGWVAQGLTYRHTAPSKVNPSNPRIGYAMSPLDNLLAARGIAVDVPVVERRPITGEFFCEKSETVNAAEISIWIDPDQCPFAQAGAYRLQGDKVVAFEEEFFRSKDGRGLTSQNDAFGPFFRRAATMLQAINERWALFAEIEPYSAYVGGPFPDDMPPRSVNASHWYDSSTLYTKSFSTESAFDFTTGKTLHGTKALRDSYIAQMGIIDGISETFGPGGAPTLIGEVGIPFDLNGAAAFEAWKAGDHSEKPWAPQIDALSLTFEAMDALKLHATLWNYTASNRNDVSIGDGWNQEDLSVFSKDQQLDPTDPNSGGRATRGFCRPYVRRAQGEIESMRFDRDTGVFEAMIKIDATVTAPTELYLPELQFGPNPKIVFDDDCASVTPTADRQVYLVETPNPSVHVTVSRGETPSR